MEVAELHLGPITVEQDVLPVLVARVGRVSEVLDALHDRRQGGAQLFLVTITDRAHPHYLDRLFETGQSLERGSRGMSSTFGVIQNFEKKNVLIASSLYSLAPTCC